MDRPDADGSPDGDEGDGPERAGAREPGEHLRSAADGRGARPPDGDATGAQSRDDAIRRRLDLARSRIDAACAAAGRPAGSVRLLLATKTQPVAAVRVALEAGAALIGENRVQELVAKGPGLAGLPHEAHMIGRLQSNKVNAALRWVSCVETVDSLGLAERLGARALVRPAPLEVMVQVNTSGEPTKSGVAPSEAAEFAERVAAVPGIALTGFMTVGPNLTDSVVIGRAYASLRAVRDRVAASGAPGTGAVRELSMGMSGDLEIAVAEGATIVRLGAAVFGPRP